MKLEAPTTGEQIFILEERVKRYEQKEQTELIRKVIRITKDKIETLKLNL